MPTLLDDMIAEDGDALAVVDDDGALSWRALGARVNRWNDVFHRCGLAPGDRVACVLGNRREAFEVLLAALHSGITVVPVNWHLTAPEIAHIVADSGSRALVVEPAYVPAAASAGGSINGSPAVLLVTGDRDVGRFTAVAPLLAAASDRDRPAQCCGSAMLYTSGTTGAPKGVVNGLFVTGAPFDRVARLVDYARIVLDVPARERLLLVGPWYHSAQLFFALLSLLSGTRVVMCGRFDPAVTLDVIDREQITAVHLVPTQFVRMLRLDDARRLAFSGSSLRRVWHGGGPCPVDVKRAMIEWWGPVLLEYYGATEGGVVSLIGSLDWLRRPGSVGRAVPPGELFVVDEAGAALPPGRTGRVFVRRRTGRSFRYHDAPEKTRSAHLEPGVFTYGELGHLDEDGFLFLTGRADDMIVSGGVNVYPAEVEAVLLAHPAVRDAAVIGVPDDEYGERVVGVLEWEADHVPHGDVVELDVHCRRSLAGFKVPRTYHVVDVLPREPTGKLRKVALRATYTEAPELRR